MQINEYEHIFELSAYNLTIVSINQYWSFKDLVWKYNKLILILKQRIFLFLKPYQMYLT